jgi:hypothetical protein
MRFLLVLVAIASVWAQDRTPDGATHADWPAGYRYVPAAYDVTDRNLIVFPLDGRRETKVLLPRALGGYALSPDGRAIYGTAGGIHDLTGLNVAPGIFRIELTSMRVSDVPASGDFRFLSSLAISSRQEEAVIAGKYWNGGRVVCGVFTLDLLERKVRQIIDNGDCDDALAWTDISVSPDLQYAVAIRDHSLELIDLTNGGLRKLGDGFMKAAWSPDGKSIAAAKYSLLQANIVLFDGKTFAARRTLASSMVLTVLWSPDSRFLLARRSVAGCGPDAFTYEVFEAETGKVSLVQSSKCKVWNNNDVGWLDRAIEASR